jgi:hypothetical protein
VVGVEHLLAPADAVRARGYRLLSPWLARWMREREQRVALLGMLAVATGLVLSLVAPLWLLALGPIVLGVPHVLSDLRYLWVRPGFHRRGRVWLLVVPLLVAGTITADVSYGLTAAALGLFAVDASYKRRLLGLALLAPLIALAWIWPRHSSLAFAHLHNVFAVALWWALWPRHERWHYLVLATLAVVGVAVVGGLFDPILASATPALGSPTHNRPFDYYALTLAPFASPIVATRIVVLFTFAQSIHYAIWLRLIPEDARQRRSPRPFLASYRALVDDFGVWLLALSALSALALAAWAVHDLASARDGYLRAAIGHGHLELAAAAMFFASNTKAARGT